MRNVALVLAIALLVLPATADETRWLKGMDLSWAFPAPSPDFPPEDLNAVKHIPGSSKSYTQGQIDDTYHPPDWFPDEHMPFPKVVASGEGKATPGCASCHLASGNGHPESANLTGLTAEYILTQIEDFKQGLRTDPRHRMSDIAKGMTEEDAKDAAAYFASLKPQSWIKVVETDTVPVTYVNEGHRRYVKPGAGTEPLGNRIIEVPQDPERVTERDPHCGFVAYVPVGSVARGEQIVRAGGGVTTACVACHGPNLTGIGPVPRIAGHSPTYLIRQLAGFQVGARNSGLDMLMKNVVGGLSQSDMIAAVAYAASLDPNPQQ